MLFSSFSFSLPSTPGLYYVDQLGLLPSNRENKGENGRVAHTIPLGTVDSVSWSLFHADYSYDLKLWQDKKD